MLTTFVIGLREGLEAALIVGIIAAFLKRNAAPRALRLLWIGVALAVAICLAGGVTLALISEHLPQRQQEMLECVIAAVAVVMITYMILWMNSHSKGLKGELESAAAGALAKGSSMALVGMAFLAVLREGFETSVFLLAAFENSISPTNAVIGVALGLAAAFVLGYLIYRGGTRINLSKFFRITGVVLVLVAAGLVMSTLRAAYEADWISIGRQTVFDLSWLVEKGSVQASILGGILGIQPDPAVIEVTAWLLYTVPLLAIVLWPRKKRLSKKAAAKVLTVAGAVAVVAAGALVLLAPAVTNAEEINGESVTSSGAGSTYGSAGEYAGSTVINVVGVDGTTMSADVQGASGEDGKQVVVAGRADLSVVGHEDVNGRSVTKYQGTPVAVANVSTPTGYPDTVTGAELQELNNGRLPIGLQTADAQTPMPATYSDSWRITVFYDSSTGVVVDAQLRVVRSLQVTTPAGLTVSGGTIADITTNFTADATTARVAYSDQVTNTTTDHQVWGQVIPALLGVAGLIALLFSGWLFSRSAAVPAPASTPKKTEVPV